MRYKCNTPSNKHYYREGAKGISVYYKWDDSETGFRFFVDWALKEGGWEPGLTLLRIDKTLDYTPENCTFVRKEEQKLYKTTVRPIVINNEKKLISEWVRETKVSFGTIKKRLDEGSEGEDLIKESRIYIEVEGKKRKLHELAKESGLSRKLVYLRYYKGKRDIKELFAPVEVGKVMVFDEELTIKEAAEKYNLSKSAISTRYRKGLRNEQLIEPIKKKYIEIRGDLLTYREISEKYNISVNTLKDRYYRGLRGLDLIKEVKKKGE
jgi:hypothetical protein